MPPTKQEQSLLIHPLVPEALIHNNRVISNIRSISGLLLGIAAGILGLESLYGFLFYFLAQQFINVLIYIVLVQQTPNKFFAGSGERGPGGESGVGAWREVWFGGGLFTEALSGFVLGWAGVGGVIR